MSGQVYHFTFGVNANYVKYAGVLMTNLVQLHPDRQLCFHLACDGINAKDRHKLDKFMKVYRNAKVCLYDAGHELDKLNPIRQDAPPRLQRATLIRLLLPQLLPTEIERFLYLDVDMICLRRLDEIFILNMKGLAVAAVDYSGECKDPAALGLSDGRYFNAGLLVVDLQAWQKAQISERALAYYQKYGNNLPLLDQDALNAAINGAFLELDKRFNFLIEVNNPLMAKYPENTVLLHCINESKAWTHGCLPEIYAIYRQYVIQSPWHDLQLSEPTTVKASFLAATSAELQGDYKQAQKYYIMTINSFTKYYQNTAPQLQLLATVKKDCLAAVNAEQQGETALTVRYYGVAAKRLIEQYLQEEH